MDTLRRLTKSKTSAKNDRGGQHAHNEKNKSKLPSSSLIARLMRFDGLRSQHPIHRQHNSFVEPNLPRSSPVALQRDTHLLDSGSHKQRFSEHPEGKDIYEDKARKSGHEDGILNRSSTSSSTQNHPKQSKIGGEEKEGTNRGSSRIVLLQPNYAMARDARNSLSLHDPSRANNLGSRKSKGHMSDWTKDEDFVETIDFVDGLEVSASRVEEAKKFAKKFIRELSETTCTTKESKYKEAAKRFNGEVQEVFSRMRTDFPAYIKEIPGTGGLHDISRTDSASESEVMKMTSYDSTESFISQQAKKRLLERWRRAQRYEHARADGKGSTLGEMLCTTEEKSKNLDATNARWDGPLGISSADGWKDKYSKIKPRSRSCPPHGTRNEKPDAECQYRTDDKLLMSKEARYRSQSDRIHGNFTEKEDFSSKTSRSSKRKSQSPHRRASDSYHISHDDIDLVQKDSPEKKPMVPPIPTVTSIIGTGARTTFECLAASSVSSDACYPDISRSILKRRDSSHGGPEHSNSKHLGAEAESSRSSKEADASPISFLEVPSREDVSSGPECFKQLCADLHDLRKQLSLLRRESKTNFDAPMHIKTEFAGEGSSLALHADEIIASECWESFYIDDVLIECGLYNADTDVFMPRSKGPKNPLGPWVFHSLEKKYCDEMSAPKYERMLLFDRIRSAVLEISQSCMNQCPWVKPMTAEFGLKWPKCELRNELHKLLATQDTEVQEGIPGKVIDKDTYWGDLRNSVDMTGTKIERSITDDLLMELVMELQFDVYS